MSRAVVYLHGQGGNAQEAKHYESLFADHAVIGFDYAAQSPWEAKEEFLPFFDAVCGRYSSVRVIANSIGAFFAMTALSDHPIEKAYFISPVVDLLRLTEDMMTAANVSEEELRKKGVIETSFGQSLSWEYLSYLREHPIRWEAPTHILYGGRDHLTSLTTIREFAAQTGATLTVMEQGEHWFHTPEQMRFLDDWIASTL